MIEQHQIGNSVICDMSIDVMDNLISSQDSSDVLLYDITMVENISPAISTRMIGLVNHQITTVVLTDSIMKRIGDFNAMLSGYSADMSCGTREYFGYFLCRHSGISHFSDNVGRRGNPLDSRNTVFFHPNKNGFLADSVFSGNLQSRFQLGIFPSEFFFGNEKFNRHVHIGHANILSPIFSICQEEKIRYSLDYGESHRRQDKELVDNIKEIKKMGDRIWIPTVADVPVEDHYKGDQFDVDYLESPGIEMTVDYAKRFAFGVDEIDLKQVKIKDWISRYAADANKQVKIAIEHQVFSTIYADADASNKGIAAGQDSNIDLGSTTAPLPITKTNVIDKILEAAECLSDNNVPEDEDWFMVIPNWMATMIKGSDLKDASMTGDNKSILRNKGLIGEIDRFKVFKSNLLAKETGTSNYHVLFGHRSAIWFVTQYTTVKMFEPEKGFAQAMKGLNVHGHGVLQPTALGEMVVNRG